MTASPCAGADGGFGTVQAIYPPGAPDRSARWTWISSPERFGSGWLKTGNSGTVALRWQGTSWADQRHDPSRGVTGGEDTIFSCACRPWACGWSPPRAPW